MATGTLTGNQNEIISVESLLIGGVAIGGSAGGATVAELNRTADTSARIVTTTATALSVTVTEHGDRVIVVNTNSTVIAGNEVASVFRVDVTPDGYRRTEDMAFFADIRELGHTVWLAPTIELGHIGEREWRGRIMDAWK